MAEYERIVPDSAVEAFEQAIAKIEATEPGTIELVATKPGPEVGTTHLLIRYTYGLQLFTLGFYVGQVGWVPEPAEGGQADG